MYHPNASVLVLRHTDSNSLTPAFKDTPESTEPMADPGSKGA
jgi:hypothetical protein